MATDNQAAPAILASTLLAAAETHEKTRPPPASSGLVAIDELALDGGFRYGEITSIAGAGDVGKTALTFHTIASHLLSCEKGEVAFIDTTGAFSPVKLQKVLVFRLASRSRRLEYCQTNVYKKMQPKAGAYGEELVDQVTGMLDRVKIMRVFDFAGVVEAVGEIGRLWESNHQRIHTPEISGLEGGRKVIDDSQDEEDLSDDNAETNANNEPGRDNNLDTQAGRVGMVIVDTISNVVSSVISKSQVQGQALLTSFMRSLHHLTLRHHICTLLINAAVGLSPSEHPHHPHRPEDNTSIFASTMGKPALGKSLTYLVDTSIFLSTIPKSREDAEIAYGGRGDMDWDRVCVLEVLKDRHGTREGRWAAFEVAAEVELKSPF